MSFTSTLQKIAWEIYFVLFLLFAIHKTIAFFTPESAIHQYYLFVKAFDPYFTILFTLSFNQILMTLIHTLALFLFIHSIPLFNPFVWQLLFLIRIIFDITGHSYELNHLMGIYQFNPSTGIILLICVLVPLIPSYIASYLYAVSDKVWK